ncbi:zinc transporter ZupT [Bacteroidales bacterium OttesenSCG-928-C19]|nr:zinc transporter ZupT [Bacteroidales bacterium OttesenSCG-928-C19]
MEYNHFFFALALTLFAGLGTGVGSMLAFFTKKTNTKFLSSALGFSAGVMIYVSFVELFPQAKDLMVEENIKHAELYTVIAFFVGILLIFLIDMLIPNAENPHEVHLVEDLKSPNHKGLKRVGIMMALAIGIHNFPEGMATFMSAYTSPDLGIAIAVAIAIHNIPEGIAVSVPIFYSTGDRKKAFRYSFLSGMAEPVGGIIGFLVLQPFLTPMTLGFLLAGVAGIMVYISVDELLPSAEKYGNHHHSIIGFVLGMVVMAVSLLLL